jgi:chromosome segregation protein
VPLCERLAAALQSAGDGVQEKLAQLEQELAGDRAAGEDMAAELSACAGEEAQIQTRLRGASEAVTGAEVAAQRLRDQAGEAELELKGIAERLGVALPDGAGGGGDAEDDAELAATQGEGDSLESGGLDESQTQTLLARVERLTRRREQLGPVNPLAQEEYTEAVAHVEELESRREDTETALRELRVVIRDTDRRIAQTFEETFRAAASNFEELAGDVFPGGSGRLRLVSEEQVPRNVLGGQPLRNGRAAIGQSASQAHAMIGGNPAEAYDGDEDAAAEAAADAEAALAQREEEGLLGVEIEITPAGKATKRLSLLSGGEKSMTALAFLFAVFLARPCPFYILDEVEAALDDLNLDRFLALLRRYSDRAQFIVITHQKRTMEAADWLYGVSMGGDGVSKVLSRRLPPEVAEVAEVA